MERTLQKDIYDWTATSKINVDVIFAGDDKTGLIVNVRIRPWKNSQRQGVMILAASHDIDNALLLAVRGMNAARWVPLDWAARQERFGLYVPAGLGAAAPAAAGAARYDAALFSSPDEYNPQDEESNAAHNGIQEAADENGELHPIKRIK